MDAAAFDTVALSLGSLADPTQHAEPIVLKNRSLDSLIFDLESMMLIRAVEDVVAQLVVSSEAKCPCHLATGQEAVAVGVARHLNSNDRLYGAHRSHSQFLALGGSPATLLAEILGRDTGCSKGMGGSMHLFDDSIGFGGSVPIVAGTVPVAVGAALAFKVRKLPNVGVAFFGDGACEEGVVHESLNMASIMGLPVIFVVENNLFSSHLDIHLRQPGNRVARFAESHAIPTMVVDGNDVVAVAEASETLIARARRGDGPGFIEAVTYRWMGHVGADANVDVGIRRSEKEVGLWKRRDPIERLLAALRAERKFSPTEFQAIEKRVADRVEDALNFARNASFPDATALLSRVYFK